MNSAYRLIWNDRLGAWCVAPEIASARGKRSGGIKLCAATLLLALALGGQAAAADLSASALPGGGQVAAGQAAINSSGAAMTINQGSQKAIINWQNFDIGSQASVNFQQPNASAVALNRVSGPTASRIEGQLSANGQVFLINPNGVLFGNGARVNVGGLVASTLNIRDDDFLSGNYIFSGNGGSITNQGQITAAPGGYLAFIAPAITNNGTISAPRGTVAMGAGERVRLNFSGDRLIGLDVNASTIDTLIANNQAIRAEGGAILLTAAGAEAVTRSVINNNGVLEASSLTSEGGRIVLTAGSDINLGSGSSVAVDGKKGGEIKIQAAAGTLLADGQLTARGASEKGGAVKLLGRQVGLVNSALVDASGTTGGGTVNVGGSRQGAGPLANSRAVSIGADARIDASATANGDGGTVIVYADEAARIYGHLSARGGPLGGHGGFIETSGKQYLDVLRTPDATALAGRGGEWLIDPNNILIVTAAGTCANLSGCAPGPNWATTNDSAQLGVNLINNALNAGQSVTVTTTASGANSQPGNITFQANANIAKTAGGDATVTLLAHNDINTTGATISSSAGRLNVVLTADSDLSGAGNVVVGGGVTTRGGNFTATGAGISGAGAINTTGGPSINGGNIAITGAGAAGSINLSGTMTTNGGAAAVGTIGRNAGNVTINGAGAVTTGAITAGGSNGNGANQAGGNGGVISVTSNGALTTGNLAASGGNAGAGGIAGGGAGGTINVTNNSTTTGTLTTGTLTARTGAAVGAALSGAAGSVNVTNRAATPLQTAAIDTRGNTGGAGGNVALTSTGGVTVTSTIQTGGGALNAATAAAGRNAGNVTIKGVNRSIAGAITASGGAAIVAGQAGGAGGNVRISGTDDTIATAGTLSTTGITASNGGANGTVVSGTAGSITLEATQIAATGALVTTGGANGAGGAITATTSTGPLTVNGAITTSGGAANANSAGRNAGNVTLTSGGALSATSTITANGTAGNGTNQAGGNGGNISLDAGGATPLVTIGGNLSALGGDRTGTGIAGAGGNITVADPLNIGAANRTISSRGGSVGVGAGGNITLGGPIYDDGGVRALTVTGGSGTVTVAGGPANATVANNLDLLSVSASDGAGKIRVGSVKTVAAQSYDSGTGGIEINGNIATLGSAGADTVTFSDPVRLTGNSSITTAGGAGDNIAISQTVNGAFGLTLNAGTLGNVSTSAAIGGGTPLTAFSATGAAVTFGQSVTAGSIFARSTTGNMTLNAGTVLNGTGTGNAIELVAGGATSRFINNAGAGALNASNGAGRFLVWSQNPANDTRGGLAYAFKQYNATYGITPVADTTANNDGFLYTLAPTITPGLTGTVTKVYDGTTAATLTAGNFTATGAVDGDTVTLSGAGTYANRNAGSGKSVTATGITASVSNGAATVYGYQVNPTSASANIGIITAAPLTVTAQTDNRVYNGSTGSAVAPVVSGTTYDTVGTAATQTFDNKNVGTGKTLSASGLVMNDGNGGNNYAISYVADSTGIITAAPLTVTAQTDNRVYNGSTASAVAPVVSGTTYDTVGSAATQTFDNKNVGTGKTLSASGLVMNDGNGGNNYAISYVADSTGIITPAPLALNAVSDAKVYDGTTGSSGVVGTVGLQGSDSVGNLSQSYTSRNVLGINASTLAVNGSYIVNDGNGGANYMVTTSTSQGTITPAPLTIAANDASKSFGAPNPPFSATYTGFVGGETPSVLGGALSFLTAAGTTSPPGNYAITPYGQTSSNYAIVFRDGVLSITGTRPDPGGAGATGADQQAIGAQYTSQGTPNLALAKIQYILENEDCKDGSAISASGCPEQPAGLSVVRLVNGGLSMPGQ